MSHSEAEIRMMSRCEACNYVLYGDVERCPECGRTPAEARRVSGPLLAHSPFWFWRASYLALTSPGRLIRAAWASAPAPWTRIVIFAAVWVGLFTALRPVYLRLGLGLAALDLKPITSRWNLFLQGSDLARLAHWQTWILGWKWPLWGLLRW